VNNIFNSHCHNSAGNFYLTRLSVIGFFNRIPPAKYSASGS
jgi:hypothetical protein